jgi:hypothetical protein
MPSRPRPLRGLVSYSLRYLRYTGRRRGRRGRSDLRGRPDRGAGPNRSPPPPGAQSPSDQPLGLGFDRTPIALPIATLRASQRHPRYRVLAGDLQRWLLDRWLWLRPRTLPIVVACAALFAMRSAVERLSAYARGDSAAIGRVYGPSASVESELLRTWEAQKWHCPGHAASDR